MPEEEEEETAANLALYIQRVLQVGLSEAVSAPITALLEGLHDIVGQHGELAAGHVDGGQPLARDPVDAVVGR